MSRIILSVPFALILSVFISIPYCAAGDLDSRPAVPDEILRITSSAGVLGPTSRLPTSHTHADFVRQFAGVDVDRSEYIPLLDMFEKQLSRNLDRITTWQGTIGSELTDDASAARLISLFGDGAAPTEVLDGSARYRSRGIVTFRTVKDRQHIFTEYRSKELPVVLAGTPSRVVPLDLAAQAIHKRSILRPEEFLTIDVDKKSVELTKDSKLSQARNAFRYERRMADPYRASTVINPWDLFGMFSPFTHLVTSTRENLTAPGNGVPEDYIRISRRTAGDAMLYRMDLNGKHGASYYFLATSSDHCLVLMTTAFHPDGALQSVGRYAYVQTIPEGVDSIVYPESNSFDAFNEQHRCTWSTRAHVLSSTLNAPIADSEFTIDALKLEEGDRYRDNLTGTTTVLKDGKFVDPNQLTK